MKVYVYLSSIMMLFSGFQETLAQDIEKNGWLFWSHQQKLSERWQFSSDVQIRSSDKVGYINTLLIRPGIGYKFKADQTVTVGYTYFGTWEKENNESVHENEHRIFEQFQIENKIERIEITNRIRFEQRFLNQDGNDFFAQRLRHYITAQIPLFTDPLFDKGTFMTIQNELFLNVQNQEKLGTNLFDQNRSYLGLGYRFSDNIEMEAGYMFRYIVDTVNVRNNILQLSVRTSF